METLGYSFFFSVVCQVIAFSSPPSFKEGLGVVAFDFINFKNKKQKSKAKTLPPPAPPKTGGGTFIC
jgi:hypothetical protein